MMACDKAATATRFIVSVVALAALSFLTLFLTQARAETLRVGKAGATAFSFVPVDVGVETGIFKKHGLDITIASFGGEAKVQQAMAADSVDIGLSSGPGLAFIVKGSPVKGIAGMAGPPLLFALVVPKDGAVKTVDDLKGAKVGISTVGSVTSWIIEEVSRQKGWGTNGMIEVPVGSDGARVAALKAKAFDAAIVNLGVALNYVDSGDGSILLRFGDLVKDFHIHIIFATDKAIAGKPETLRAFMKGWLESVAYMRTHKDETVKIAMKVMRTDLKNTTAIYDELMPMFSDDGRFNPKALATLRRSFVEMNTLPQEPDMTKLIDESLLPKH